MERVTIDFSADELRLIASGCTYFPDTGSGALILLRIAKEGRLVKKTTPMTKTEVWEAPGWILDIIKMGANGTPGTKIEKMLTGLLSKKTVSKELACVNRGLGYCETLEKGVAISLKMGKIHIQITPRKNVSNTPGWASPPSGCAITMTNGLASFSYLALLYRPEIVEITRKPAAVLDSFYRAAAVVTDGHMFGHETQEREEVLTGSKEFVKTPLTPEIRTAMISCLKKGLPLDAFIALK